MPYATIVERAVVVEEMFLSIYNCCVLKHGPRLSLAGDTYFAAIVYDGQRERLCGVIAKVSKQEQYNAASRFWRNKTDNEEERDEVEFELNNELYGIDIETFTGLLGGPYGA
ncbi:hypothetical protein QE152_g31858 [Popillia japonica]|uniref:Uncharacterized protein n=1 Tax=Popillia japonica TaxID=7064 RepID=A0AAW1J0W4_POPJA